MTKIESWLIPLLEEQGCSLYEIEWDRSMQPPVLRIAIDKNGGTTDLDTCAAVSDLVSAKLDETNDIDSEYMLEVCSSGAEKALRNEQEIKNAVGSYVYVKFKKGQNGLNEVRGDLGAVDENGLLIKFFDKGRPKKITVPMDNIAEIRNAIKM